MHLPRHHHPTEQGDTAMTSATPEATETAVNPNVGTPAPEPVSPSTLDTTIPVSDPSDPASVPPAAPVAVQPASPAPASPDSGMSPAQMAQQYALFQAWQASNAQAAAQAAASGAVTAGPSHHVFHSSVDVPEGVENAFQTSRGITLYVAEDSEGNTRTYAVTPNGSTESVEGDVYDSVTTLATLLGL